MQYGRMVVVSSLLMACSAPIESTTEATTTGPTEDGSTSSPSTTSEPSGVTSTSTSTSTPASNSTSTSSLLDSSSGSTGAEGAASEDDGGCGFLCDPDGGSRFLECDIWDQDCPRGEKCTPWVSDGGSSWNAMRCVPVAPDPDEPGEPCTKKGEFDSCALGSICWDIDAKTGEGTCVSHCVGSDLDDPSCPAMTACTPFFEDGAAYPEFEHVGVCTAEAA